MTLEDLFSSNDVYYGNASSSYDWGWKDLSDDDITSILDTDIEITNSVIDDEYDDISISDDDSIPEDYC